MRKVFILSILILGFLSAPSFAATASESVRAAQQVLKEKGFDPGPVDGVSGPKTRSALRKFQAQQHLTVDGTLSPKTLESLGVKQADPATAESKGFGEKLKDGATAVGRGTSKAASKVKGAFTKKKPN